MVPPYMGRGGPRTYPPVIVPTAESRLRVTTEALERAAKEAERREVEETLRRARESVQRSSGLRRNGRSRP